MTLISRKQETPDFQDKPDSQHYPLISYLPYNIESFQKHPGIRKQERVKKKTLLLMFYFTVFAKLSQDRPDPGRFPGPRVPGSFAENIRTSTATALTGPNRWQFFPAEQFVLYGITAAKFIFLFVCFFDNLSAVQVRTLSKARTTKSNG